MGIQQLKILFFTLLVLIAFSAPGMAQNDEDIRGLLQAGVSSSQDAWVVDLESNQDLLDVFASFNYAFNRNMMNHSGLIASNRLFGVLKETQDFAKDLQLPKSALTIEDFPEERLSFYPQNVSFEYTEDNHQKALEYLTREIELLFPSNLVIKTPSDLRDSAPRDWLIGDLPENYQNAVYPGFRQGLRTRRSPEQKPQPNTTKSFSEPRFEAVLKQALGPRLNGILDALKAHPAIARRWLRLLPLIDSLSIVNNGLISRSTLIRHLATLEARKLDELFTDDFAAIKRRILNDEKTSSAWQAYYTTVERELNKDLRPILRAQKFTRTSPKAKTVLLKKVSPLIGTLRSCFGSDCSSSTTPITSLDPNTEVYFLESKDYQQANTDFFNETSEEWSRAYVLVVDTNYRGKTIPYFVTFNGQLNGDEIPGIIKYLAEKKGARQFLVTDFSVNHNVVNSSDIRQSLVQLGGKKVDAVLPANWDDYALTNDYYTANKLKSAKLVDLNSINISVASAVSRDSNYPFKKFDIGSISDLRTRIDMAFLGLFDQPFDGEYSALNDFVSKYFEPGHITAQDRGLGSLKQVVFELLTQDEANLVSLQNLNIKTQRSLYSMLNAHLQNNPLPPKKWLQTISYLEQLVIQADSVSNSDNAPEPQVRGFRLNRQLGQGQVVFPAGHVHNHHLDYNQGGAIAWGRQGGPVPGRQWAEELLNQFNNAYDQGVPEAILNRFQYVAPIDIADKTYSAQIHWPATEPILPSQPRSYAFFDELPEALAITKAFGSCQGILK